jgi:hypothetical protein
VSSILPGGSFVSEYLINSIPNQRLERVTAFVKELDKRLTELERNVSPDDRYFADLVEDGIVQSSRALSVKRAQILAHAVIPYDPRDAEEWETRKKLLQIMGELTDRDIEILQEHLEGSTSVQRLAWNNWQGDALTLGDRRKLSDEELFRRESKLTLLDLHLNTLTRLHLLMPVRRKPSEHMDLGTVADNLDADGNPQIERHRLTATGRLLLSCVNGIYPRSGP